MPKEIYVNGDQLKVGDVILTWDRRAGAVLMEKADQGINQSCWFETDKGVIAPYRRNQTYGIIRATKEELDDAMGKNENDDKPYKPKHEKDGGGDAQERKEVLETLPTYQTRTPASDATALPAPVQHVENGDWGGLDE